MLSPFNYFIVLGAVCAYAILYGRRDERFTALICIAATLATKIAISPFAVRYSTIEFGVALVDIGAFFAFTGVALRSDRFWPLWIAGLQLTTTISHMLKGIESSLMPQAYAAAGRLWVYPILLILVIGTWRGNVRERAMPGQQRPAAPM